MLTKLHIYCSSVNHVKKVLTIAKGFSFHLIGPIIEQSYFINFNDLAVKLTKVSAIIFSYF